MNGAAYEARIESQFAKQTLQEPAVSVESTFSTALMNISKSPGKGGDERRKTWPFMRTRILMVMIVCSGG
jgi:hypothetical protein